MFIINSGTICTKCQSLFSEKNKKKYLHRYSANTEILAYTDHSKFAMYLLRMYQYLS